MNRVLFRDWQSVRDEVLRRIHARDWKPGELIPNEADLAIEFGCARTTMNRALRSVAETGLLDRRRKAGTRVAVQPVAKATLDIAVMRLEVEDRGQNYSYQLISRSLVVPPDEISQVMKSHTDEKLLHVHALHLADDKPYALEDRWLNLRVVPDARTQSFQTVSANEWLLRNTPYTHGEIEFSATAATPTTASLLACSDQSALFTIDRVTWDKQNAVTKVQLLFAPGHKLQTRL